MIEVKVYNAETDELIGTFDSINLASYECGVSASAIKNNILGKTEHIKGMYFRSDSEIVNKPKNHYNVYMFDAQTGELLNTFDTLSQAAKETGIDNTTIHHNITGITKTVCKKRYVFSKSNVFMKPTLYTYKNKANRHKNKKAGVVYDRGEYLRTFDSVGEAAEFIGCSISRVTQSCKLRQTIKKQYRCKYQEKD